MIDIVAGKMHEKPLYDGPRSAGKMHEKPLYDGPRSALPKGPHVVI